MRLAPALIFLTLLAGPAGAKDYICTATAKSPGALGEDATVSLVTNQVGTVSHGSASWNVLRSTHPDGAMPILQLGYPVKDLAVGGLGELGGVRVFFSMPPASAPKVLGVSLAPAGSQQTTLPVSVKPGAARQATRAGKEEMKGVASFSRGDPRGDRNLDAAVAAMTAWPASASLRLTGDDGGLISEDLFVMGPAHLALRDTLTAHAFAAAVEMTREPDRACKPAPVIRIPNKSRPKR